MMAKPGRGGRRLQMNPEQRVSMQSVVSELKEDGKSRIITSKVENIVRVTGINEQTGKSKTISIWSDGRKALTPVYDLDDKTKNIVLEAKRKAKARKES